MAVALAGGLLAGSLLSSTGNHANGGVAQPGQGVTTPSSAPPTSGHAPPTSPTGPTLSCFASYAAQVAVADRWAIVAYIRALQLSQHTGLADVPPAAQAQLSKGHD